MPWLLLHYQPTTLFSLKSSLATSSVARTLIIPTPYAVKMAFVDAAFRCGWEEERCRRLVRELAGVAIRIRPGSESVVTQTIQKIRQEERKADSGGLYVSAVAYRELAYVHGVWTWALSLQGDESLAEELISLAPRIHYVGKRGSMLQFLGSEWTEELGPDFTVPMCDLRDSRLPERAHIGVLDDFGPEASFPHLNSFDPSSKPKRGKHRILVDTLIPAGIINSGPGFVQYSMKNARTA